MVLLKGALTKGGAVAPSMGGPVYQHTHFSRRGSMNAGHYRVASMGRVLGLNLLSFNFLICFLALISAGPSYHVTGHWLSHATNCSAGKWLMGNLAL